MLVSVISGGVKPQARSKYPPGLGTWLGPVKGLYNGVEVPIKITLMSLQWKRAKSLLTDKVLPVTTLFQR